MVSMGPYRNSTNSANTVASGQKPGAALALCRAAPGAGGLSAAGGVAVVVVDAWSFQSSLRISTMRVRPQMIISTTASSITALAAASGNCRYEVCTWIDLAHRGNLLPAHHADGHEVAHDDGDDEDGADEHAGFAQRMITFHSVCQAVAPASLAASTAAVDAHHAVEDGHDHEHGVQGG